VIIKLSLYLLTIFILEKSFALEPITDQEKYETIQNLQPIELLFISRDLEENYELLVYGHSKQSHVLWFAKKARIINEFLQNREGLKIPEYAVVVNELIKYANRALANQKAGEAPLKMDETYLLFIEMFENLNTFVESLRSDPGYRNLRYIDVIDMLLKVTLFSRLYDSFIQKSELVTFLREVDELDFRHIIMQSKIEKFVRDNEIFYKTFPKEHREELNKIHDKNKFIEVHENGQISFSESFPTKNNSLNYPFYFILVRGGNKIDFKYFKSLPFSHFLHIPYSNNRLEDYSLLRHLKDDAMSTLEYLERILDIDILKLITSNSPNRDLKIELELLKNAKEQGIIWDSLEELFEGTEAKNMGFDFNLDHFTNQFFREQHELRGYERKIGTEVFVNDYSPNKPESLLVFFRRFLLETQEKLKQKGLDIDIEFYVQQLENIRENRLNLNIRTVE
jgi:hypothetical protein